MTKKDVKRLLSMFLVVCIINACTKVSSVKEEAAQAPTFSEKEINPKLDSTQLKALYDSLSYSIVWSAYPHRVEIAFNGFEGAYQEYWYFNEQGDLCAVYSSGGGEGISFSGVYHIANNKLLVKIDTTLAEPNELIYQAYHKFSNFGGVEYSPDLSGKMTYKLISLEDFEREEKFRLNGIEDHLATIKKLKSKSKTNEQDMIEFVQTDSLRFGAEAYAETVTYRIDTILIKKLRSIQ